MNDREILDKCLEGIMNIEGFKNYWWADGTYFKRCLIRYTRWLTKAECEQKVKEARELLISEIETEWGWFTENGLEKIIIDDNGYFGRKGSMAKWESIKEGQG